jgi:hypothetical protein
MTRSREREHARELRRRFAEETAYNCFVPDSQQWDEKRLREGLRKRSFPVAWWPRKKDPVTGLEAIASEQLHALLLLNKLCARRPNMIRKEQIL